MNEQEKMYKYLDTKYDSIRKDIDSCFIKGQKENVEKLSELGIEKLIPREYFDSEDFDCLAYFVYKRPYQINEMIIRGWKSSDFHYLGVDYLDYFIENKKELASHDYKNGSVVIYYQYPPLDNSSFTHIGVIDGDKIVSKFAYLSVFRHPIECVPSCFGKFVLNMKISNSLELDINNFYKNNPDGLSPFYRRARTLRREG